MKMIIKTGFNITVSITGFVITFYTVGKLMIFLSNPDKANEFPKQLYQKDVSFQQTVWSLFINMSLIGLFMFQHTVLALQEVKDWFNNIGLGVASRSIYIITTSLSLLTLMNQWRLIPVFLFWNIDVSKNSIWWAFAFVHLFAWSAIYGGGLLVDILELLGIKQVYYEYNNHPDPLSFKSVELQRLYSHVRHPSFTSFLLIFWVFPVMSLDRFFLAIILTAYMLLMWKTDSRDYDYQHSQLIRKQYTLASKLK